MAAYTIWSEQRRKFISALIPNKKILFANINSGGKSQWKEEPKDYDLIVAYYKDHDIYIICKADKHIGCKNSDFSNMSNLFKSRHPISVGYKREANRPFTKERVLIVHENEIEKFCRDLNYYLDIFENNT